MKQFRAAKSLCNTLWWCRYSRPDEIWLTKFKSNTVLIFSLSKMYSFRSVLWRPSNAINGTSLMSDMQTICSMFGCFKVRSEFISWRKSLLMQERVSVLNLRTRTSMTPRSPRFCLNWPCQSWPSLPSPILMRLERAASFTSGTLYNKKIIINCQIANKEHCEVSNFLYETGYKFPLFTVLV